MAEWTIKDLKSHVGHEVELVTYLGEPVLECADCGMILLEFHEKDNILTLGPKDEE